MKSCTRDEKFPALLLVILIGVFLIDAALFNSLGYSGGLIFSLLIIVMSLFLSVEKNYYLLVFSFSFASILKFSESSISIIPVIYLIIILKLAIQKKAKFKTMPIIAICILIIFQLLSIVVYQNTTNNVVSFLLCCLFVIYSASCFSSDKNFDRFMLKNACLFFAISIVLNILLSDIFPNICYIVSANKQELLEAGDRFGALFVEPNEFSQVVLVAIAFLVATFSSYKTMAGKIGIVALILYLIINGVRSNSKSYVLTLFGLLCVFILIYMARFFKNKKTSLHFVVFLVVLLLGIVAGYFLIVNVVFPVFELRGETSDTLTGRDDIWKMYIDALAQRFDVLFVGCGAGNSTEVLRLVNVLSSKVPHNFYLDYIVQFGILGFVLLLISWSEALNMARRKSMWFWLPALAFLVTAFGISANANDCVFITLLLLSMPSEFALKRQNE